MLNGTAYRRRAAHDLTLSVNPFCVAGTTQRPEIFHHSVFPEKRMMALAARWSWQISSADNVTGIGDPSHKASVPSQGTQVRKQPVLPQERMIYKPAG